MSRFKWYRKWKGGYWLYAELVREWHQVSGAVYVSCPESIREDWT